MIRTGMIGRGVARSIGQIAISVVATLIATQIYAGLQRAAREEAVAKPVASLTSGGKYDTRIAGAALPPLPEPARPALSIVDWAITPRHPTQLVADIAWSGPLDDAPPPGPAPRPARREAKRAVATSTPAPVPVNRPTTVAMATMAPAPVPAADHDHGLLSVAGAAAQDVVAMGGAVVAFGGAAVGRLVPWTK